MSGEKFLELIEGHIERDCELLLFGVFVDIDDVVDDNYSDVISFFFAH